MIYRIFLSPQAKRWVIITYKHGIYELPHELPNSLKLKVLGNIRKFSKTHEMIPQCAVPLPKNINTHLSRSPAKIHQYSLQNTVIYSNPLYWFSKQKNFFFFFVKFCVRFYLCPLPSFLPICPSYSDMPTGAPKPSQQIDMLILYFSLFGLALKKIDQNFSYACKL